jgi:hypothetical protein
MKSATLKSIALVAVMLMSPRASIADGGRVEKRDLTVVPKDFTEKTWSPRQWTQRTNPLFSLEARVVDDIHLAYEGEAIPVLVLSNKTDKALTLSGNIVVRAFGGKSFAIDASGSLDAGSCRCFELGRRLEKGPWHAEASLETAEEKAVAETRFAVVRLAFFFTGAASAPVAMQKHIKTDKQILIEYFKVAFLCRLFFWGCHAYE